MEWSDLRIFLTAVRAGSYTLAGTQLGVNRTTVGRRIDALEAALGVALFKETPFGPEPTQAGQRLLETAARMEAEATALLRALTADQPRRETIRISSSAGLAAEFLQLFDRFQQQAPATVIEVVGLPDPLEALSQRRADLAIALVRQPPRRLAGTKIATLSQARYGRRGGRQHQQLGWGREIEAAIPGQWTSANPVGDEAEASGLPRFNSWDQLKQAVLHGMGEAHLWCFAADAEPMLERLAEPESRHDCPLWLLHRAKSPPSPGQRALMTFLETQLPSLLGAGQEQG
ncbi:MAG: LysR family transcriptional regulator [Erythrobacter sp.]|nr:LysR family transcriptional regulator [Erythrobacter sp.]